VCETIALTVGLGEDAVNLDGGLADLGDVGSAAGPAVRRALAAVGSGRRVLELAPADLTVLDPDGPGDPGGPEDLAGPDLAGPEDAGGPGGAGGNVRL
jgi:hypothetical protein